MDRIEYQALRNRAAALLYLLPKVSRLIDILSHPDLSIAGLERFANAGIDQESLIIIDPYQVRWPEQLYVVAELDETSLVPLQDFRELLLPISTIYDQYPLSAMGFFQRFLRTDTLSRAQQAAAELKHRLSDPRLLQLEPQVQRLIQRAELATKLQQQGIELTTSPYRETIIELLRTQLQAPHATVTSLSNSYVIPAARLVAKIHQSPHAQPVLAQTAASLMRTIQQQRSDVLLRQMPVELLKTVTDERLRFSGVEEHGIFSVFDVLQTSVSRLENIHGIGLQTARRMKAAAQTLASESENSNDYAIGNDPNAQVLELLTTLVTFEQSDQLQGLQRAIRTRLMRYFPLTSGQYYLHAAMDGAMILVAQAPETLEVVFDDIAWANATPEVFLPPEFVAVPEDIWADYQQDPARYQALLERLIGASKSSASTDGLSADTLAQIRACELDESYLKNLYLRGYQNFGAKFCVVQRKVVIGDEMGLGKTIQALAVAAHVAATDTNKIVAVVPASLLVNWSREVKKFTNLDVYIAHGDVKHEMVRAWDDNGGVLIVTYAGARALEILTPSLVIIDEGHFIKNPQAQRSQACQKLIHRAKYAIVMTGTPIENNVDEFIQLLVYVQPQIVTDDLPKTPQAFRRAVAGAYLRRNQQDVLDELPEKVVTQDWVELSQTDLTHYKAALISGNWMDVRRAAYQALTPNSAKVERIRELVDEATHEQKNVLIFSYFRDVLERLAQEFSDQLVGVIHGGIPPKQRQELVDQLGVSGNVLIAQIGAGGVGLNIQKASVVILAESQVKPSLEDQAIARAHRMGQTQIVQVHKILGHETVDERLVEILATKREVFDQFARKSDTGEIPDAVDISEGKLAEEIIAAERKRLGLETVEEPTP
ncbi:SNF2-related protein [Corynebacterium sp. HS2168-gen11]|uniref:SNF2-related protein n=1 Tax=Corynebacterium sp. HS2168-gen11 TaxID=2974027 RepID=UPI00216AE3AB|nr:SNF2-related protein [Corynebacterium sp. HS2168-gen11]MCS4535179.1 SNF2-related protein [Corynebacterium sp. HS2168-gen11]